LLHQRPTLCTTAITRARFNEIFGTIHSQHIYEIYAKKTLSHDQVTTLNHRLATEWPFIAASIRNIMLPGEKFTRIVAQLGLQQSPQAIGLTDLLYAHAVTHAHLTRDRFTFLDLAAMQPLVS
jgi:glycerol-1-phosphate dehydrogenase [NAD(P)+]